MNVLDLSGKTALVLGIANRWSIAYAIGSLLQAHGARLAVTYQNERVADEVLKLTGDWPGVLPLACELTDDAQVEAVFERIRNEFGSLNYLIHCIAFADRSELQGPFRDISRQGFHTSLDISAYTLVAAAQRAVPLMPAGESSIPDPHLHGQRARRAQLQRHGTGEGRPGKQRALPGKRSGPAGYPRQRHLRGTGAHRLGARHQRLYGYAQTARRKVPPAPQRYRRRSGQGGPLPVQRPRQRGDGHGTFRRRGYHILGA